MGDGDASRATNGHQAWGFVPGACVWSVCCSHCVHPPGHGGTVSIPSCPQAALVRQKTLSYLFERPWCCIFTIAVCLFVCFLLRVEFQNKFYSGNGVKFCPFSFSLLPSVLEHDGIL